MQNLFSHFNEHLFFCLRIIFLFIEFYSQKTDKIPFPHFCSTQFSCSQRQYNISQLSELNYQLILIKF